MATVLGYVGPKIIAEAGVRVPVPRDALDHAGTIQDPQLRQRLEEIVARIVEQGARLSG